MKIARKQARSGEGGRRRLSGLHVDLQGSQYLFEPWMKRKVRAMRKISATRMMPYGQTFSLAANERGEFYVTHNLRRFSVSVLDNQNVPHAQPTTWRRLTRTTCIAQTPHQGLPRHRLEQSGKSSRHFHEVTCSAPVTLKDAKCATMGPTLPGLSTVKAAHSPTTRIAWVHEVLATIS
jgi:hypothetical protein